MSARRTSARSSKPRRPRTRSPQVAGQGGAPAQGQDSARSKWFFHPALDLIFGAGLGYLVTLPIVAWIGFQQGITEWPLLLVVLFSLLISGPHYGATLLRVYEQRADRTKYALFAVHLTSVIVLLFFAGLHFHLLGSLIVTLYITWSPWHFGAQNYGIALLFLRRRGVEISPDAKRWLYASFVACYALAFLALHADESSQVYAVGFQEPQYTFSILRIGIPLNLAMPLLAACALAYAASTFVALRLLLRHSNLRELLPSILLILSQALWFAYPAVIRVMGYLDLNSLVFAATWVSTAHSLQYLWITSYYAKKAVPSSTPLPFLSKAMLLGAAQGVLPGLLFAPALLGTVHWNNGLALLVFSTLNVHHFMLDGAVWKLRDGRVARALLQLDPPAEAEEAPSGRPWLKYGLLAAGALSAVIPATTVYHLFFAMPRAGEELNRVERSAKVLGWLGQDHPAVLGRLAFLYQTRGQYDQAIDAYRKTLGLFEDQKTIVARHNLARLLAIHGPDTPESAAEAVQLASLVVESTSGDEPTSLDTLAAAYARAGRFDEAVATAEQAAEVAASQGNYELARKLRRNRDGYQMGQPLRD